jgi:hypothetical protein
MRLIEAIIKPFKLDDVREALARISHQVATATAHLRTLAREIGIRLLDVPPGTPPGPNADFSRQSADLHRLATQPGEICGLGAAGVEGPTVRIRTGERGESAI